MSLITSHQHQNTKNVHDKHIEFEKRFDNEHQHQHQKQLNNINDAKFINSSNTHRHDVKSNSFIEINNECRSREASLSSYNSDESDSYSLSSPTLSSQSCSSTPSNSTPSSPISAKSVSNDSPSVLSLSDSSPTSDVSPSTSISPSPSPLSSSSIYTPSASYLHQLHNLPHKSISIGCGDYIEADYLPHVVRGASYMKDQSKVQASVPFFEVEHVEIFSSTAPIYNIASVKDSYIDLLSHSSHSSSYTSHTDNLHPLILISFMFPVGSSFIHFNSYFKRRVPTHTEYQSYLSSQSLLSSSSSSQSHTAFTSSLSSSTLHAFDTLLSRYLSSDDDFKNNRMKLIPRAHDANWIVRKVVGQNPSLLCKSIKSKHYNTLHFGIHVMSVDLDITTSTLASNILSVVKGYAKSLCIDLMFLLQGEKDDELCESLIGGVRMMNIDLDKVDTFQQNIQRNKAKLAEKTR